MKQTEVPSTTELAEMRTELALDRTSMAATRSLMAWIRTGLSLNGFGFTAYKIIQSSALGASQNTARDVGLFVIGMGILSILVGSLEYWKVAHDMKDRYGEPMKAFPLLVAGAIGMLGVVLFVALIIKIV